MTDEGPGGPAPYSGSKGATMIDLATVGGAWEIGRTEDNVILAGDREALRRLAEARGLTVEKNEGPILSAEGGRAIYAPASPENFAICYYLPSGLLMRGRDEFTLVMPRELAG